jgi:hypothetical protein
VAIEDGKRGEDLEGAKKDKIEVLVLLERSESPG